MRKALAAITTAACLTVGTAMAQPPEQPAPGGGIGLNIQAQRDKANKKVEPPTLDLKSSESATWPMIATVLFAGACLLAAIIPPKRGHQD
ncbi:MAG TPA: hypothetical protein VEB22_01720 [Phycisphaerales bacterium]|nr:hypothetical protein [Phycisphaerales bacterium]